MDAARALGTSPMARESVFAALWAFLSQSTTYVDAVTTAARMGGDTDSMCAMTGALAGALHGLTGIPEAWLDNLQHERPTIHTLIALCDQLTHVKPSPHSTGAP